MSKPKYNKGDETIVEEFKEWTVSHKKTKAMRNSINSIIWMSAVIIFLGGTLIFHKPHIIWLVFLLAAVVNKIVNLSFSYHEADDDEPGV
jgi:hypothetical protein